jgi:hypothetical protein
MRGKINVKFRKLPSDEGWRVAGTVDFADGTFERGQTCEAPNREWALGLWMATNARLVGLTIEPDFVE